MISCIIPVYNEEKVIKDTLENLSGLGDLEVIVVDGESSDSTRDIVKKYPVTLLSSSKGRAHQMDIGATAAGGNILLFLHADCVFEQGTLLAIKDAINQGAVGGCLTHKIKGKNLFYRTIEFSGNIRAKISKTFYGDQGIFVRKDIFSKIGGFGDVALFEDVIFSRRLRKEGRTCILDNKIYTRARRWEKQGIVKATLINWVVTIGFILGIPTQILSRMYYDIR